MVVPPCWVHDASVKKWAQWSAVCCAVALASAATLLGAVASRVAWLALWLALWWPQAERGGRQGSAAGVRIVSLRAFWCLVVATDCRKSLVTGVLRVVAQGALRHEVRFATRSVQGARWGVAAQVGRQVGSPSRRRQAADLAHQPPAAAAVHTSVKSMSFPTGCAWWRAWWTRWGGAVAADRGEVGCVGCPGQNPVQPIGVAIATYPL